MKIYGIRHGVKYYNEDDDCVYGWNENTDMTFYKSLDKAKAVLKERVETETSNGTMYNDNPKFNEIHAGENDTYYSYLDDGDSYFFSYIQEYELEE